MKRTYLKFQNTKQLGLVKSSTSDHLLVSTTEMFYMRVYCVYVFTCVCIVLCVYVCVLCGMCTCVYVCVCIVWCELYGVCCVYVCVLCLRACETGAGKYSCNTLPAH